MRHLARKRGTCGEVTHLGSDALAKWRVRKNQPYYWYPIKDWWRLPQTLAYSRVPKFIQWRVSNDCTQNGCDQEHGENFLNLETAADFEKFKVTGEKLNITNDDEHNYNKGITKCTTDTCFGVFYFQFAWKVDDCTVFVLELKQNWNPLRPYTGFKNTLFFTKYVCRLSQNARDSTFFRNPQDLRINFLSSRFASLRHQHLNEHPDYYFCIIIMVICYSGRKTSNFITMQKTAGLILRNN